MQLTVQKTAWHEVGVNYTRTNLAAQPCCEGMRAAWDGGFVGYGSYEDGDTRGDRNVNIYKFHGDEEVWLAMPISFCPFCGAPVEIQHAG